MDNDIKKPVRFEAGKKLTKEEKKEVYKELKDSYRVNLRPHTVENDKIVWLFEASDYMTKSDITGRLLRWYIYLPDGRIAHPTEVFGASMPVSEVKRVQNNIEYNERQSDIKYNEVVKLLKERGEIQKVINGIETALNNGAKFEKEFDSNDIGKKNPFVWLKFVIGANLSVPQYIIKNLDEVYLGIDKDEFIKIKVEGLRNKYVNGSLSDIDWERFYTEYNKTQNNDMETEKPKIGNVFGDVVLDRLEKAYKQRFPNDKFEREALIKIWNETKDERDIDRANSNLAGILMSYFDDSLRAIIYSDIQKEAKELEKGIAVEQEHKKTFEKVAAGDITPEQAAESIAKEHLAESPEYYKELDKMEEKLKNKKDIDYSELPPLKREDLELVEAFKSADKNTKKIKFIWNGDFYEWEYSSTGSGGGIHIRKYDSLRKLQNPLSTTGTHETIYNTWNSYQTTPEGRYIEYSISKMNKDDIFGYDNNNLTDSKISLKVEDYKNPYQINKAIEKLIDQKGDSKDYSSKELEFISYYSGYGGLEKFGEIGKERLKGLMYEFYTPDAVVKKMWALAYKYGYGTIADNSVFEPSVGIGAFLKYAPSNVRIVANEINEYSAKICEILYPQAKVELKYFEQNFIKNNLSIKSKIYDLDKYSLVIGNPPYGVLNSKYIGMGEDKFTTASNYTEYFITRGLDLLVQDGLLIYIVGAEQYNGGSLFLDSGLSKVKEMMFDKADLVDAYRLPVNIFERTGVSSEIVVFKKR